MPAKFGEMFPDRWNFGKPALHVHAEQLCNIRGRKLKSLGIEARRLGKPANRRIYSVNFAGAAFEDPFQHRAVLAVSGPEEFAVAVGAEPVNVIDFWQLCAASGADLQIVGEVVAHIVATEREHSHWVTAKFTDVAGGGRGRLAADSRAQKRSVLPAERLSHQRDNASPAATEKDGVDRHATGILPLRGNHRALARASSETRKGMRARA